MDVNKSDALQLELLLALLNAARAAAERLKTPLYTREGKAAHQSVLGNLADAIGDVTGTIAQLHSTAQQDIDDAKAQEAISKRLDDLRGH